MMQEARLQQLILASGLLHDDQLQIARKESQKTNKPLSQVLTDSGFIERRQLRDLYAGDMALPTVTLEALVPDAEALSLLSAEQARTLCVFPLTADPQHRSVHLAVASRLGILEQDLLQSELPTGWSLSLSLATEQEILASIDRFYGVELSIDGILVEMDEIADKPLDSSSALIYEQPVVRLVDAILVDALRRLASDIHFEPEQHLLRIRYRIDGVLRDVRCLHKEHWPSMLVRIKVMCSLNITETRAPQDGHLRLMLDGRSVDFRTATFPVIDGECVVIRLLDRQSSLLGLETLGFGGDHLQQLRTILRQPQGLLLVTGPTGGGKTTTLYSILGELASEHRNIVTMEDPVEFVIPMIRQCSVNLTPKLNFADGVRAMLRQDPDVILVGETRDAETASMVLRAALTGHLVLTTLHSATALGAFYRLRDLGVRLGFLSELLHGIIAQKLVRALCESCKQPIAPPTDLRTRLPDLECLFEPGGCSECGGSGYRGRLAVVELLTIDKYMHRLLANDCGIGELAKAADSKGHQRLVDSAFNHLAQGKTSLEEIQRVTGSGLREWATRVTP